MAVILNLVSTADQQVLSHLGDVGQPLVPPTPLSTLTRIERDSNPYQSDPLGLGLALFQAMGGAALLERLEQAVDKLLLLVTDEQTAAFPWEYAATPDGNFLVLRFGCLRLLPQAPPSQVATSGPLNLIVLAADPLVDQSGQPILARSRFNPDPAPDEVAPRLNIEEELAQIQQVLRRSGRTLSAVRVPPTEASLDRAMRGAPAILHLSCHGTVIRQQQNGHTSLQPILFLEDDNGRMVPLRGDDLSNLVRYELNLVVMSACRTALSDPAETDASLARALVASGSVPAAVGMQADFPDPLSADFATSLYDNLLMSRDLSHSLRRARLAMKKSHYAVGLPVAYVAPQGWAALTIPDGSPQKIRLDAQRYASLPASLTPPRPLIGRETELHQLAAMFGEHGEHRVVTVVGSGGIGKTALATTFAGRFGWRWPEGVVGVSLADQPTLSPETVLLSLLRRLMGEAQVQPLADQPAEQLFEVLLAELRRRGPLLLVDNYETVLQALKPDLDPDLEGGVGEPPLTADLETQQNAARLHRLLARLADAGQPLLLTSRQHPAGFRNESVFPPQEPGRGLGGLSTRAGAELFLRASSRANKAPNRHRPLAEAVAKVTEGHPLAIMLLGSEFTLSEEVAADRFLDAWAEELAAARNQGVARHHETFATAFGRSFEALSPAQQERLIALRRLAAPFFAEGGALLWGIEEADEARPHLNDLVRRSLLAVEATFADGTPATYRLEPVILRHLRRHYADPAGLPDPATAYPAYAGWLVNRCYGDIYSDVGLANLAPQWLDELILQADQQPPERVAGYCRQLAWLLRHYGRLSEADPLLAQGEAAARQQEDKAALASLFYEQATLARSRGDLEQALQLYDESLAIQDKLGDLKGRSATLSEIANVYLAKNDWDKAEALIQEALSLAQRLNAPSDIAFHIVKLGQVAQAKGDAATARQRYQEGLTIFERLGMPEANQVRQMLAGLDQPGPPPEPPTEFQVLISLTQATTGAVEGKHPAQAVTQAIRQAQQELPLSPAGQHYLSALGAAVDQAEGPACEALQQAGQACLPTHSDVDTVNLALSLARLFDRLQYPAGAVALQAEALERLRGLEEGQAQQALSVALYNQAGYLAQLERLEEAIAAMEEVVAIDKRLGLADLESDQARLEAYRRQLAGGPPAHGDAPATPEFGTEPAGGPPAHGEAPATPPSTAAPEGKQLLSFLQRQLEQAPAEAQAELRQFIEQVSRLSPEEQAAIARDLARQQFEAQANQVAQAALAAQQAGQVDQLVPQLEQMAADLAEGEEAGSPYANLAQFVRAVIALLGDQRPEPVASEYVARLATLQQQLQQSSE